MPVQPRSFQAVDPFGRTWSVEFRWLQNAISIRHADSVDLKYYLDNGEEKLELVLAFPNPALASAAAGLGREVTDAWCLRLGALHLERMVATWEDMEKSIVTLSPADLARHAASLAGSEQAAREQAHPRH
jgi:hypothetical protein